MFRSKISPDEGMLFVYPKLAPVQMWMLKTYMPLDMLFIDGKRIITQIVENAEAHSTEMIRSHDPVLYVLEVKAGTARRLGLHVGDTVRSSWFENGVAS